MNLLDRSVPIIVPIDAHNSDELPVLVALSRDGYDPPVARLGRVPRHQEKPRNKRFPGLRSDVRVHEVAVGFHDVSRWV